MPTWWARTTLYAQLAPDRLVLRNTRTGARFDEPAVLALKSKPDGKHMQVAAVGAAALALAGQSGVELVHPFRHPRSLLVDFVIAEQLLKAAVRAVWHPAWFAPTPRLVMHPLGAHEGGLTAVEVRALKELAMAAGAGQALVWQGVPLTDEQLQSGHYPQAGQVLAS